MPLTRQTRDDWQSYWGKSSTPITPPCSTKPFPKSSSHQGAQRGLCAARRGDVVRGLKKHGPVRQHSGPKQAAIPYAQEEWRIPTRRRRLLGHDHEDQQWVGIRCDGTTRRGACACREEDEKEPTRVFYVTAIRTTQWLVLGAGGQNDLSKRQIETSATSKSDRN